MDTDRQPADINKTDFYAVSGLLMVSFLLRLYAFFYTTVINRDGVWYINQAKAIFNNDWVAAKSCGYDFISLYHLLIPVFYRVTGDWILAAKVISLVFGSIAVIPFYFILRHFFRTPLAFVASLAFAMNPFFVSYSVELVKDPTFWFFGLLGIYFFITAVKREKRLYFLLFSNISFLLAAFARFEGFIYLIGSVVYIVLFEDRKLKKLMIFVLPVLLLFSLASLLKAYLVKEALHLGKFYFVPRAQRFFSDLSASLLQPDILEKSLMSLKLLIYGTTKVLYIPFIPFFLISLLNLKRDVGSDRRFRYLIFVSLLSLIALYLFYVKIQILSPRYTVFFILPALVFACSGIERIVLFLTGKGLKEKIAVSLVCFYVVVSVLTVPSKLLPRKPDKIIYKTVGEYVAKIEENRNTIIMAPDSRVMFYANLYSPALECGNRLIGYRRLMGMKYDDMIYALESNNVKYFVWEAKSKKNEGLSSPADAAPKHFKEVMRWDENEIVLYRMQ
ncbi:MAG: glycosyltransferase family 39 protein [Nitrospirota bacterium]